MKRAEEMRELFARWEKSGQSLQAFGKTERVSYSKLLYWRRKFRDKDIATASASPDWTEVRVVSDSSPPQSNGKIEVWLANGISLEVPADFNESELRRLVGVLVGC